MSKSYNKNLLDSSYYVGAINEVLAHPLKYGQDYYDGYANLQDSSTDGFIKPTSFLNGYLVPEIISDILLGEIYEFDLDDLNSFVDSFDSRGCFFDIEFLLSDINRLDITFKKYLEEENVLIDSISEDNVYGFALALKCSEGFNAFIQQLEDDVIQELAKDPNVAKKLIDSLDYKHFFKPKARLLLQLGDQLIKDEGIALFELVKNSYDADATYSKVLLNDIDNKELASIIIKDNGSGMDYALITNHWLQPGTDLKEKQIKEKHTSPIYKRLPLGEKGIGRFGVHKLGQNIVLYTKTDFDEEVKIQIDWKDFEESEYLDTVPINIKTNSSPEYFKNSISTISKDAYESLIDSINIQEDVHFLNSLYSANGDNYILVNNLKQSSDRYKELKKKLNMYKYFTSGTYIKVHNIWENWSRGMLRSAFRAVNAINSPFEDNKASDFTVRVSTNKNDWLDKLLTTKEALEQALFHVDGYIENSQIHLNYNFSPLSNMKKLTKRQVSKVLDLEEKIKIYDPLKQKYKNETVGYSLENLNIGKVEFEFYIYDLGNEVSQFIKNDISGLRMFLQNNGGIRIYRDKIRVYDYGEPGNDWLNLDFKRVSNPTQKISNNQLIGALYLERESSKGLIEKTNREGFIINQNYEKFAQSIGDLVSEIAKERSIDKALIKHHYGPKHSQEPVIGSINKLSTYVDNNIQDENIKNSIKKQLLEIETEYTTMTENLLSAAGSGLTMNIALHEIEKVVYELIKRSADNEFAQDVKFMIDSLHNTILTYSNMTKIKKDETVSLKEVIKKLQDVNFHRLIMHNITVIDNTVYLPNDIEVKFTEKLLIASLSNILDNAIYWLDETERSENSRKNNDYEKKIFIDITYDISKYPAIVIADNGIGFGSMPTEIARKAYTTNKKVSMGLGLYIIDETMKLHDSRLIFPEPGDVESIPDEFNGAIVALELGENK